MTTPRDDIAGLIERLQDPNAAYTNHTDGDPDQSRYIRWLIQDGKEAATQLAALSAENAELKAALDRIANVDNSLAKQLSKSMELNAALSARVENLHREHDAEKAEITGRLFDAEARVKELEAKCADLKRAGVAMVDKVIAHGNHATRLQQELDTSNDNHRAMAKQLAMVGQERDEAFQSCIKAIRDERVLDPVTSHDQAYNDALGHAEQAIRQLASGPASDDPMETTNG